MAMTDERRDLLTRIENLTLDQPGASLPFSARLARENGWSADFAERVVAEYRRFVFLAAAAGHPVTPSDEVDQAWHLHLVYTRSYWDHLCGEVLGFPLHHGPTVGGAAEGAKFTDWYQRTLDSYQRLFGTEPPVDIWPAPRRRFANAERFRRVNTAEQWVLPKPALARPDGARRLGPVAVAIGALTLTGCLAAAGTNTTLLASAADDGGDTVAMIVFVVIVVAVIAVLALARTSGGRSARGSGWSGGGHTGCSAGGGDGGDSGCGASGCGGGGCGGGGCGA